jgi:hypothetical protein
MVPSTRRKQLEDYAQNVLRAQMCQARGEQFTYLALGLALLLGCFLSFWIGWLNRSDRKTIIHIEYWVWILGYGFSSALAFRLVRYWRETELLIRSRIDEILALLSRPGEPDKEPDDFKVQIVESVEEMAEFSSFRQTMFRQEPLIVFPQPVDNVV